MGLDPGLGLLHADQFEFSGVQPRFSFTHRGKKQIIEKSIALRNSFVTWDKASGHMKAAGWDS